MTSPQVGENAGAGGEGPRDDVTITALTDHDAGNVGGLGHRGAAKPPISDPNTNASDR